MTAVRATLLETLLCLAVPSRISKVVALAQVAGYVGELARRELAAMDRDGLIRRVRGDLVELSDSGRRAAQ